MDKDTKSYLLLLILLIIPTLIYWVILIFNIPFFENLPDWAIKPYFTNAKVFWVLLGIAIFGIAIFIGFSKSSYYIKIISLIFLGSFAQYAFIFSQGGVDMRMTGLGHGEFAKVVVKQISLRTIVMEYEEFVSKKYYAFLTSKPPGTLLFYAITSRVTDVFYPTEDSQEKLQNLAKFATITWPIISCIIFSLLFYFTSKVFDNSDVGISAVLFYVTTPALNLITLVTDQTIYPLLAFIPILLFALSIKWEKFWLALLSGIAFYIALYFSFGLAVVGFLFIFPLFFNIQTKGTNPIVDRWKYVLFNGLGFVLSGLFMWGITGYDLLTRYNVSINHHLNWKGWDGTIETFIAANTTNLIEFFIWVGIPFCILFIRVVYDTFVQITSRNYEVISFYNLSILIAFLFLLFFGKTKAETSRLWFFLIPFMCISVAEFINRQNWLDSSKKKIILFVLILQIGTTIINLYFQNYS